MRSTDKGLSAFIFIKDRLLYVLCVAIIVGFAVSLYLLEKSRYTGFIDSGTIWYFILLALVVLGVWLTLDYLRQRYYFNQLKEAIQRSDELKAYSIVRSLVTGEQQLVATLLEEQHRSYMNELGRYRRRQELHNHFVLQWVHHMKTPVSVIDLLMQEAERRPLAEDGAAKELIASVQEETERLTRGLEMMLSSARLERFEIDLHPRRVALHELARSVVNAHKKLIIRHSIYPRIEGEAWAETDEKWMSFVLNQLIGNAIKYSKNKPGGKSMTFRLEQGADGSGRLEIEDQGIGIAPQDLPRIFDPFFTGENGRLTGESTGMGLYLARQVCERLGHSLSIVSVLHEGTTATLAFKPGGIHRVGEAK